MKEKTTMMKSMKRNEEGDGKDEERRYVDDEGG